jgi:tetratricopeptide (TPR) repeat protein
MASFGKQLRSPATTPAKDRRIPTTPTREITWQSQAMAAMVARTPSNATPPRSRSARQRHEAKNGDVVGRTTRELERASGEVARALRMERATAYTSTGNFDAALDDLAAAQALSVGPLDKNGVKAQVHFQRGEVLAKKGRPEEAIQAYSACLAEDPAHAKAAYRRAACRNPLDARAADDYEAALALDATPDAGAPSPSQRRPSLRLGVDAYAAKLEEDAAKGHFRAHFDRAYAYDASNDLPNAISEYTAAIKVLPAHALAWYNRGICRERLGDAAAALDDFTEAIQRAEASKHYPVADFYHNRAFCRRKLADFSGAVDDYALALERDPRHFKALYNRAFCLDALGQREAALRDYESALAVEARHASAHHNRGVVLEKLGRLEDAVEAFDNAVDCGGDRTRGAALYARATILDKLKKYKAAKASFDGACAATPKDAEYHHARGANARHRGDHAAAAAAFSAALKLEPTHKTARANRAYARRKIGDFVGARRDYTKALEDAPTAKLYNARAYCSAKLEKFDAAVADYTEALRLDPANAHALHNRGILYDRLGRDDEAARDFERALELENS